MTTLRALLHRLLTASADAVITFRMSWHGWRVDSYSLPFWQGFGREYGRICRYEPTYPEWEHRHPKRGWRITSHGVTFCEVYDSPTAAVSDKTGPGMTEIAARQVQNRERRRA